MRKADEPEGKTFTYQARLPVDAGAAAALDAYAELFGRVERTLFAQSTAQGVKPEKLKNEYLKRFGITAWQFNAIRVGLDGKIDSVKERRTGLIDEAKTRLKKAQATLKKLGTAPKSETPEARVKRLGKLHQKTRRAVTLAARLEGMQADHKAGKVRIAFGSRRLFRAQFDLSGNGFADHAAWRDAWHRARSEQFSVLGSKDETGGCQGCVATLASDGTVSLRLRLPDALITADANASKYVELHGIRFAYGMDNLRAALACGRVVERMSATGKRIKTRDGKALTWRFVRDDKGWRVFVSVSVDPVATISTAQAGAVGADFNADHLAVAETDRHGNLIAHQRIDLYLRGMSTDQRRAAMGDAVKQVVERARASSKPIVIERLDFREKKARLEGADPARARMLSALAYRDFDSMLRAAAFRAGIDVIAVNPAYTSVIGAVNHAARLGISVHAAAAFAIARRGLGLKERPFAAYRSTATDCQHGIAAVPVRNGGHVTFALPARNRAKHVWTQWAAVRSSQSAAHAGHFRSGTAKAAPAPLSQAIQAVSATRKTKVRSLGANRQQHCSAGVPVFDDVPF
ncbi:IS200/IS605 family accessory protein TnpB-related protein [Sphaerotilus sp.]|uniref:IS200/IS605 family accessory protein TnpB-related protein n=1 Tax=Sphaerotilus sp. TaxID=2093942 RepID=UPI00286DEBA9|nr:IS200/IS605 family accessory protein TnpB-related protein [Sphaerotilus sp.]